MNLSIIKAIYDKLTAKIMFSGEKLKAFLCGQEQDKYALSFFKLIYFYFWLHWVFVAALHP